MKIENVIQGTPEWISLRKEHLCASDAAAMLGLSKQMTRHSLLTHRKLGTSPEHIQWAQINLLYKGHQLEAAARARAELVMGELFPITATLEVEGLPLLASLDGFTLCGEGIWEHKMWNMDLVAHINTFNDVPDSHWPQIEQQLLVTGAEYVRFTVSNDVDETHIIYKSLPERRRRLLAGWKQFLVDLEGFDPTPREKVVADPIENLPALAVQLDGKIAVRSNIDAFGERMKQFITSMNFTPVDEQGFVNLKEAAKELRNAEQAIKSARAQVVAGTDLNKVIEQLATLEKTANSAAIRAEKAVQEEREKRKSALITEGFEKIVFHVDSLPYGTYIKTAGMSDFGRATKGLKTLDSFMQAVSVEVGRCIDLINTEHVRVSACVQAFEEVPEEYSFLFPDKDALICGSTPDHLSLLIEKRISEEDDRQQKAREAKEASTQQVQVALPEVATLFDQGEAIPDTPEAGPAQEAPVSPAPAQGTAATGPAQVAPDTSPPAPVNVTADADLLPPMDADQGTMKLGDINAHISPLSIDKDGLAKLGFSWVGRERAAYLYPKAQLPAILKAIIEHLQKAL